jgi:hypothetical protein
MSCDEITVQIVIITVVLTFILADDRDVEDLEVLGEFISSIGDLVSLMAAQKGRNESLNEKVVTKENIMKQIKELQLQCEKLK